MIRECTITFSGGVTTTEGQKFEGLILERDQTVKLVNLDESVRIVRNTGFITKHLVGIKKAHRIVFQMGPVQ